MRRRRAAQRALAALLLGWLAWCGPLEESVAFADARTDYLVRALRTSPTFRVRAQAALSLGSVETEPAVIGALIDALGDPHATVRAAAAHSLERHSDPSALPALRRAESDSEAAVRSAANRAVRALERVASSHPRTRSLPDRGTPTPSGSARFYVAIGRPGTNVSGISRATLDDLQEMISRTAGGIPGVEIAPSNENRRAAERVLSQRSLTGYYLDTSIVSLEEQPGGSLRARVSIVVQSYPDRNIRSMLNGAATVTHARGPSAQRQAIEGALTGALRNLNQVMEATAGSPQARAGRRRR